MSLSVYILWDLWRVLVVSWYLLSSVHGDGQTVWHQTGSLVLLHQPNWHHWDTNLQTQRGGIWTWSQSCSWPRRWENHNMCWALFWLTDKLSYWGDMIFDLDSGTNRVNKRLDQTQRYTEVDSVESYRDLVCTEHELVIYLLLSLD